MPRRNRQSLGVVFYNNKGIGDDTTETETETEVEGLFDPKIRVAMEPLRKMLVFCMREGCPIIINCDRMAADFKETYISDDEHWPSDIIFNQQEWLLPDNHMKIVREDENFALGGMY